MIDNMRTWSVEAVVLATTPEGRSWNKNINLQVIATTLEEAVAAARQRYPEIKFIKVMADRWINDVIIAGVQNDGVDNDA